MKSNIKAYMGVIALIVASAEIISSRGQELCGMPISDLCPTCPSPPSDTSCFCGLNGGTSCGCVKTSGGLQSGTIAFCQTNYFSYIELPTGFDIIEAELELCATFEKCKRANGSQVNCAPYNAGPPASCGTPFGDGCAWRSHGTPILARIYEEGAACDDEID